MQDHRPKKETLVAAALILCAALVAFWQVMSSRGRHAFEPFELTSEDFDSFQPRPKDWGVRRRPTNRTPTEPNILVLELTPGLSPSSSRSLSSTVLVRLVHGYNMCDCMRLKGYEVELISDTRNGSEFGAPRSRRLQVWRLTSSLGEVSIWVTSMLRAGNLAETSVDVRSMAFPRIGTPDPAGWLPQGMTWRSLRHPIRNFRAALNAKWNNSRCDLLTFLGLRRPAWASDEMLTLVGISSGGSVRPEEEEGAARHVIEAHGAVWQALQAWRVNETGGAP